MANNIENTQIFKRLKDYRVDFVKSKATFFEAAIRVSKKEKKKEDWRKWLEIGSILLSIFMISGLALSFLTNSLIVLLSILSIGINIYFLSQNEKNEAELFNTVGNAYLELSKKAKNLEALAKDDAITIEQLRNEIENLHYQQTRLFAYNLVPLEEDYSKANKFIQEGNSSYTTEDYQNT